MAREIPFSVRLPSWSAKGRLLVFLLAATSIGCLLADFYGVCPMQRFAMFIFGPALLCLFALVWVNSGSGDHQLANSVLIGLASGLIAAVAYDIFRLPFVFANQLGIASVIPPLNLYKAFPRFGAMLLGQSIQQTNYSVVAQILGWMLWPSS